MSDSVNHPKHYGGADNPSPEEKALVELWRLFKAKQLRGPSPDQLDKLIIFDDASGRVEHRADGVTCEFVDFKPESE